LFSFIGCEHSVEEEEFPFELKLVVRGVIEDGKQIKDIYVGRTLPVAVKYDKLFADLSNAAVAISIGDSVYILTHQKDGLYYSKNLFGEKGKTYKLIIQWEDKFATAETRIPNSGSLLGSSTVSIDSGGRKHYFLENTVLPYMDEVYTSQWQVLYLNGGLAAESTEFGEVVKRTMKNSSETLKFLTSEIPTNYIGNNTIKLAVKYTIYDEPYYYYFLSHGSNQISDAIWGQSSGNVRWNVKGDGIGIFIGKMDTVKILK
jgi:hypothetical protein